MEKIIQLKETEYNKLNELATLTEEEINARALKMYQERGTFAIHLKLDCLQDVRDEFTFKASAYIGNWDGKYPLKEEDKRNIVTFVERRALKMMQKWFGRQIGNINYFNRRIKALRDWKMKFIGLTILGWLAAVALTIIAIVK